MPTGEFAILIVEFLMQVGVLRQGRSGTHISNQARFERNWMKQEQEHANQGV
jgi:hypothetical protein